MSSRREVKDREKRRVDDLIRRDIADAAEEQKRQEARREVEAGDFSNLDDTILGPTPEWHRQTESVPFTPDAIAGTVRAPSTVRAAVTPAVIRMWRADKLTDDQAAACIWYRFAFDNAGISGHFCTTRFSEPSQSTGRAAFAGHIAMTITEAEARRAYRSASSKIPKAKLKFFEEVVLNDTSIFAVWRLSRGPRSEVHSRMRKLAQRIFDHCEQEGVDFTLIRRDAMPG